MEATATTARLKTRYLEEIRPQLMSRFGYSSIMQAPRVEKVTLNMGVGEAKQDSKVLKSAREQLGTIAGQQPSVRRARKSIAAFKLREGNPVGVSVTLRGERAYEFLDRLVSIAIPRIRDFRGLNPRSFDGRGNYSMGVREQIIFPEIDYDAIDEVRGLDITITTSAATDAEAFALLLSLGLPFATQGRPAGFDDSGSAAGDSAQGAAAAQAPADEPATPEAPAAEQDTEQAVADDAPADEPPDAPAEADATAEAEAVDAAADESPDAPAEADATAEAEAVEAAAEQNADAAQAPDDEAPVPEVAAEQDAPDGGPDTEEESA
jgi:large subunit ribosomal protein L5